MGVDLDWEDVEQREHFQTQKNHGNNGHSDRKYFAKVETATSRFKAPRNQAQNVQGCEAKDQHPEEVVNVALLTGKLLGKLEREKQK